jgi:Zn-finger nucleic acid-binding protein
MCPCCSTNTNPVRWKDLDGFECPTCKGHVVQAKQLERFLEKHGPDSFGAFMALTRAAPASRRPLSCPGCGTASYRAVRRGLVEIDVCATCLGVFFDAGEAAVYLRQSLVEEFRRDSLETLFDCITDFLD